MSDPAFDPEKNLREFEKSFISDYLKYGSVDEVFKIHRYDLPISYSDAHRLVKRWGIVKAAGPNARLSEALEFLTRLSDEKVPLECLYKKMPLSFKTSMATLHRILTCVRKETIRRVGTALVITPENDPNLILVGSDVSTPRPELGKFYGSVSLPMGYSSRTEQGLASILRVLQQEVFTDLALDKKLPVEIIPANLEPFMYLDIADVRVAVYHLKLPEKYIGTNSFSSFKLVNHRYLHSNQFLEGVSAFRTGIKEIGLGYLEYLEKYAQQVKYDPIFTRSILNQELAISYSYI